VRLIPALSILVIILSALNSCSGTSDPISPQPTDPVNSIQSYARTSLWGYYDVYIDVESKTVEIAQNRNAMFTANVVNFINSKPANLGIQINNSFVGPDYIDVDVDVSITHPFPGLTQYNGYDVRGVFMGNGSASLISNPALIYAVDGADQTMLNDDSDGFGGPDGYTRWYNLPEFSGGGMPLFQYTQGSLASKNFDPSATLNPYKYYADTLGATDDAFLWLNDNPSTSGVFSSGSTNTRNYYIRFPDAAGVRFGYAVIANWEGPEEENHPSNAPESVACDVEDSSTVYYVDPGNNGGILRLDFSLFNWDSQPSAITVESTVLSAPHQLTPDEMSPVGGSEHYSTYHLEISADSVDGIEGNEYWIIASQDGFDYSNDFGVPNDAETDTLTAYFRYNLDVSPTPGDDPVCDLVIDPASPVMPYEGWGVFTFDASGSYDPNGSELTFVWDFNDDGVFGDSYESGTDDKPVKLFDFTNQNEVCVRVSNDSGGESECCVNVDIIGYPTKNIQLRDGVIPVDVTIDHNTGDLFVLYDDKSIYQLVRSEFYQNETLYIQLGIHLPRLMYAFDMNPSQWTGIALTYVTDTTPGFFIYDNEQNFNQYIGMAPPDNQRDAYSITSGAWEDDMGFIRGATQSSTGYPVTIILRSTLLGSTYGVGGVHSFVISDGIFTGIDRIYYPYIQGVETDVAGPYMWILEDPDYYVSRWYMYESGSLDLIDYDNAYFGTGSQTDADNGWNDARDLTRDDQNNYFVLDELSNGDPRIKMWSIDGDTTTSEGGFGDSNSISGSPIAIEGSDFSGEIVVLHGDTAPFMVSVFFPVEMPTG